MSIRIGLVGAGLLMEAVHLPALRRLAGVEIAAVADLDVSLAERLARANGIPKVYDSAESLVGSERLDGVVVVTRKNLHAEACLPGLERGLPVLVEKPLEASLSAAKEMVDTAKKTGARLMVGYMKRFDPAVQAAQQVLSSGRVGLLIYGAFHDFGGDWTAGFQRLGRLPIGETDEEPPVREKKREAVTDPFDEWAEVWIHDVNLARAFFGEPKEVLFSTKDRMKIATVEFEKGRVTFEVGALNRPGHFWDERFALYCEEGRIEASFPPPLLFRAKTKLIVHSREGLTEPAFPYKEAFFEQDRAFVQMIQNKTKPLVDGADALKDLLLCDALCRAAQGVPREKNQAG